MAVSASSDQTLNVWEVDTGPQVATSTCDGDARCCAFAKDERLVGGGDKGGYIHFLRLEKREPKR